VHAPAWAQASAAGLVVVSPVGSVRGQASDGGGTEASAHGSLGVGRDGLSVGAGAGVMAGSSAGAGYSVDGPAGTRIGSEVSVKAGIGAEFSAGAEFGWDRVGFSLDAGVALGIGLGISLDISFSPSALLESLSPESLLDTLVGSVESVIDTVGDVADAISDFFDPPGNPNELLDRPRPDAALPPPQPGPADVSAPVGASAEASVSHPVLRAEVGSPAGPEGADLSRWPEAVRDVLATGAVVAEALPESLTSLSLADLHERVRSATEDFFTLGGRTWS